MDIPVKLDIPDRMERNEMWEQLGRAADSRSSEDLVLWTIFGAFWGTNGVLLVALFVTGTFPTNPAVGIVVSLTGVLLSTVWRIIQLRSIGHLKRYEMLMDRLERRLDVPSEFALSASINEADYQKCVGRIWWRARTLMRWCSSMAAILWLISLVYFGHRLVHL
jgi:hypothetical protein